MAEQRRKDDRPARSIDAGSEPAAMTNTSVDNHPDADRPDWLVPGDYAHALLHLAWLIVKGKRYLVFGLVELYPSELPPPDETAEMNSHYRDDKISHRIYVKRYRLTLEAGLSWYTQCCAGRVVRPGDVQTGESPELLVLAGWSEDPPWPNLVATNGLPFVARTWGTVRVHHLLPTGLPDAVLRLKQHDNALEWFSDRLFFDLSEYREWVGSVHLLAPNPVFRELDRHWERAHTGEDATVVRMIARAGQPLDDLQLHLTVFGPTGVQRASVFEVAGPVLRVPHVGTAELVSHQVVCPRRGVLDWSDPQSYISQVAIETSLVVETRKVRVPDQARRPGETYDVQRIDSAVTTSAGAPPANTPMHAVQLAQQARRLRMAVDEHVEEWFHGGGARERAADFVRSLVGSASRRVWIIDPYLATAEVYRFALSVTRATVEVKIVTSSNCLNEADRVYTDRKAGGVLLDEIIRLRSLVPITAYVMTGQQPIVHDRFLVIDDTVWLSGNSLHTLGERASMIVKLSRSSPIVDKLEALLGDRSVQTIETWVQRVAGQTVPRRSAPRNRLARLCQSLPTHWRLRLSKVMASLIVACSRDDQEGVSQ